MKTDWMLSLNHATQSLRLLLPVLAICVATVGQAQSIVVRSTGPSAPAYARGKRLPAGAMVTLRSGDVVTILDKVSTRVLRGAGTFKLDGAVVRDNGFVSALSRTLSLPTVLRAGTVRGLKAAPSTGPSAASPPPNTIWLADIDKGGNICVPSGGDVYLWRGDTTTRRFGWLGEVEGGRMARLHWPSHTAGVSWPMAAVPLQGGHSYRISDDGSPPSSVDFEVVSLGAGTVPDDAQALGALLLDKGCTAQFEWLANSLEAMKSSSSTGKHGG